jgi:hypothetical protein
VSFLVIPKLKRDIGITLLSCRATLQVLMLLLLSLSHISLELILQRTIGSNCLLHLLSLFLLRVPYLPLLFLYLPMCLCLQRLQLLYINLLVYSRCPRPTPPVHSLHPPSIQILPHHLTLIHFPLLSRKVLAPV